jgi:hypothetical protein
MNLNQKLATVILATGLSFSIPVFAQSAQSTDRPADPAPSLSDPALNSSDVRGVGTDMERSRGTVGIHTDFARVDTDGDGRISRSEFAASPIGGSVRAGSTVGVNDPVTNKPRSSSTATTEAGVGANKNASELFRELDRNNDGYLNKTEFDAYKATDRASSPAKR